jgi:acyl-coenzyme A synthetase/AMP-(fatty) acid ligase
MKQIQHGRVDTCSIHLVGGFVSDALLSKLRETVTTEVFGTYSTNETSLTAINRGPGPGILLPDAWVRIVDDAGRDRNPGVLGNILRALRMADGHIWDRPQTARQFDDGWFRPNDIGVMPELGQLVVLRRTDETIDLGG